MAIGRLIRNFLSKMRQAPKLQRNPVQKKKRKKKKRKRKKSFSKNNIGWVVVAHTFNPSTLRKQRQVDLEFEANLIYKMSSRTVRATQRNLVLKNTNKNKRKPSTTKRTSIM